jgi:hypothetical protein
MQSGKEVKKKINVFEAMHYIIAAWRQVSQQTIQNCGAAFSKKDGWMKNLRGNEFVEMQTCSLVMFCTPSSL